MDARDGGQTAKSASAMRGSVVPTPRPSDGMRRVDFVPVYARRFPAYRNNTEPLIAYRGWNR